ncbi:MAG: VOC family protein [Myxococcota bacterium]
MEKVRGIGGVFFKSKDPDALKRWYAQHLGVPLDEQGYVSFDWKRSEDGSDAMTVWSPFSPSTKYFDPSTREFMVNFIVDDLDAMLQQLRDAGCTVDETVEDGEFGSFGWVLDPDGTRIELWQPPATFPKSP